MPHEKKKRLKETSTMPGQFIDALREKMLKTPGTISVTGPAEAIGGGLLKLKIEFGIIEAIWAFPSGGTMTITVDPKDFGAQYLDFINWISLKTREEIAKTVGIQ